MLPMRAILVAVDFSEPSKTAVRLAARLARRFGATLHLLHVEEPLLAAAAAQAGVELTAQARSELEQLVAETPEASCLPHCIDVVIDGPVHGILTIAEREHVDLIIVARHGMSGVRRVIFGSVTQQVLREATRSVLVVPDDWTLPGDINDVGLGPIVLGIEGTCSAILAARAALGLAAALKTTIEAIHVVPKLAVPDRWRPHADRAHADRVELAKRDISQLMSLTVPEIAKVNVSIGDVAEQLTDGAALTDQRRPLLVLGRREPAVLNDVPGATAERTAAIANVPVLMFRERAA